jgi:hypothetical protein
MNPAVDMPCSSAKREWTRLIGQQMGAGAKSGGIFFPDVPLFAEFLLAGQGRRERICPC